MKVLVVNVGLEMRKGKICAQCAHAAIGVYRKILNSNNDQHKKWLRLWGLLNLLKMVNEIRKHCRRKNCIKSEWRR